MKKTFKDLVTEGKADEQIKSMLRGMDNVLANDLRQSYYGVGDHITTLVEKLNATNGATGEFGADLKAAKAMLKAYDKITLGKYI